MEKKTAYVVRYYKDIEEEKEYSFINCYLSYDDFRNNHYSWSYEYSTNRKANPTVLLSSFFDDMLELQRNNYEIIFWEQKDDKEE